MKNLCWRLAHDSYTCRLTTASKLVSTVRERNAVASRGTGEGLFDSIMVMTARRNLRVQEGEPQTWRSRVEKIECSTIKVCGH